MRFLRNGPGASRFHRSASVNVATAATFPDGFAPVEERDRRIAAVKRYIAVTLTGVAGISTASVKAILIGTYVNDFGTTAPVAGYLLSAEMIAATAGTILSTLIGGRAMLVAAFLAIVFGDFATATSSAVGLLFACQIVAGLGHGFALGRVAQGIATVEQPQRLTACYTVTYLALSSVNALFLPDTKAAFGPHALFFVLASTGILGLLAVRWYPDIDRKAGHRVIAGAKPVSAALAIFVGAAFLLWYIGIGGFWPFVGQFGAQAGIPFDERTRILGSANLFGLAGASLSFLIGNRFGSLRPLCCLVSIQVFAILVLIFGGAHPAAFMAAAWLYVFAWLGGFPFQLGLLSKIDPSGRLNALTYVMGNLAYATGPAAVGILLHSAGSDAAGLAHLQYAGLALLVLSGGMILSLGPRADRADRNAQSPGTLAEHPAHSD